MTGPRFLTVALRDRGMPYVTTPGAVHADDCPHIVPDVDPVRYVREAPAEMCAADCDCRRV